MPTRTNQQTVEHIDPRSHPLISGLDVGLNLLLETMSYNAHKQHKFVPYRVKTYAAPMKFGDIGEFLIGGEWVVAEFGGEWWINEARRLLTKWRPVPHAKGTEYWLQRMEDKERELDCAIMACSMNGVINTKTRVRVTCKHGVSEKRIYHLDRQKWCCEHTRQYGQHVVICPHCGSSGAHNIMLRWHFDNCKQK